MTIQDKFARWLGYTALMLMSLPLVYFAVSFILAGIFYGASFSVIIAILFTAMPMFFWGFYLYTAIISAPQEAPQLHRKPMALILISFAVIPAILLFGRQDNIPFFAFLLTLPVPAVLWMIYCNFQHQCRHNVTYILLSAVYTAAIACTAGGFTAAAGASEVFASEREFFWNTFLGHYNNDLAATAKYMLDPIQIGDMQQAIGFLMWKYDILGFSGIAAGATLLIISILLVTFGKRRKTCAFGCTVSLILSMSALGFGIYNAAFAGYAQARLHYIHRTHQLETMKTLSEIKNTPSKAELIRVIREHRDKEIPDGYIQYIAEKLTQFERKE